MAKTRIISVTAADIKKGQENLRKGRTPSTHCAICVALRRIFKKKSVSWACGSGSVAGKRYHALTSIYEFESQHDIGLNVKPFKFTVEVEKN